MLCVLLQAVTFVLAVFWYTKRKRFLINHGESSSISGFKNYDIAAPGMWIGTLVIATKYYNLLNCLKLLVRCNHSGTHLN